MTGILKALRAHDRQMTVLPCPGCGATDRDIVWRRDRYFLRVDLSICRVCGLVHLARGFAGAESDEFYRTTYPRLMQQPPPPESLWRARIEAGYRMAHIRNIAGPVDQVLEVGSGLGFFLDQCRESGCTEFFGIEPGGPQRAHAETALGLGDHIAPHDLAHLAALPFTPRLVTLFHVLEHLDEPGQALDKLAGWIAPDGCLVIEVPDIEADWTSLGLWQVHVSHRSYFSERTLRALLAGHGFTVWQVEREAFGIFPGNLRVFARPAAASLASAEPGDMGRTAARIKAQIKPWSLTNGYPRAAIRLLRLAFGER